MKILKLSINMVYNRMKWKEKIHSPTTIYWEQEGDDDDDDY